MGQENITEVANQIHFSLDRNGVFLDMGENVEMLTGFKKEEAIGQNFRLFVNPQDQQTVCLHFQNIVDGVSLPPCEFRIITKSGEQILVKTTASAIKENGVAVGLEGTFTKI